MTEEPTEAPPSAPRQGRLGLLGIAAVGQTKTSFAVGSTFKRSMPSVDQTADVFEFRR
jgi:hypothetical protein